MDDRDESAGALSWPQTRALSVIYEAFRADCDWPTFQHLSSCVWGELEVEARDLYYQLSERDLVRPRATPDRDYQLRDDTQVAVSLRGLMYLSDAAEDLAHFVAVVRYIAERAAKFRPSTSTEVDRLEVTGEEVRLELGLQHEDSALARVGILIREEAWTFRTTFSRLNSGAWSLHIEPEKARQYRDIHTVIEFLDHRDPKQQEPSWPASPVSLGSTHAVPTTDNKKVMVVHGRDKARNDLFNFLRALGLDPIEWSTAVKSTGTTKPYTGQAVEAAFDMAQAAVILLVEEEQVVLRMDLRDPKDPSDAQLAWQPRPNVFYEGGIAVTSHPDRTIVLELGRPRTATDLAGVNTIRIASDQGWRHELANRLRDAGCPVNTDGKDWLTVGEFAEPDLASAPTAVVSPASRPSVSSSSPPDDRLIEIAAAARRAGLPTDPQRDAACLTFLFEKDGMFESRDIADALPPPKLQVDEFRKLTSELAKSALIDRNPNGRGWVSRSAGT